MRATGLERFNGRTLGVATLHGKERAIGPALMTVLPLAGFHAIDGVVTDRFGAFSGEVQRDLGPLETCIAKAKHGVEVSSLDLVIASEGSFGPYPPAPFISCNEEILVLFDARDGTLFTHKHVTLETVHGGERVSSVKEALVFAERMKFPEHQLVLRSREKWSKGDVVHKGIGERDRLVAKLEELVGANGSCWIETDLRAMANPTRMKAIAEAAERFAAELVRLCPVCGECWFRVTGTRPGLPCSQCGWPTGSVRGIDRSCRGCGHVRYEPRHDDKTEEDPGNCENCNP